MARYGQDYGRNFDRWNSMGSRMGGGMDRGFGGQEMDRGYGGGMGRMGYGGSWRDYPDEGGWSGGRSGRGYDMEVGEGGRSGMMGGHGGYGSDYYGGMGSMGGSTMGRGTGYEGGFGGGYQGYGYGHEMGGDWERSGRWMGHETGRGGGWQQERESRMRVSDIMTENPECVTPDATLADVARKMRDLDVGIIPVVESMDNRRLKGVITDRDIAVRAVAEGKDGKAKVSDCMSSDVETVNKNDSVQEVLDVMESSQVRRVPVTDREGRLVGIIAQADLATDYAEGGQRERQFADTMERISEPARPDRSRSAMQAGGRGGSRTGSGASTSRGTGTTNRQGGETATQGMQAQGRQGSQDNQTRQDAGGGSGTNRNR